MAGVLFNSLKLLLLSAIAGACLGGVALAGNSLPLPDPVATVNGAPISRIDLRREVGRLERSTEKGGAGVTRDRERELLREGLDNLIARELLYQEAKKSGITVPAPEVAAELVRLKGSVDNVIEFEKTLGELQLSEEAMMQQAERAMIARSFIDKRFTTSFELSEDELKSYFEKHPELFQLPEQVRFRHILVKFEPSWQLEKKEIAHKKALKLRARLLNGEKFEKVAAEASDCPSRERGGDLGWFKRGQLAPFMERTLLNLKIDALSEPVDDHFGYHIIQVTDRRSARSVGYSEAKPKISEHLRQEQAVRKAREFAGTLRNRSKVEIFLPTSGTLGVR